MAPSMPHSEEMRRFFENLLFRTFGEQSVKRYIVEFMPSKTFMEQGMTTEDRRQRFYTFFTFYFVVTLVGFGSVEVLRYQWNRSIKRAIDKRAIDKRARANSGSRYSQSTPAGADQADGGSAGPRDPLLGGGGRTPPTPPAQPDENEEEAAEALKRGVAGFYRRDVVFAQYHVIYIGSCIGLVIYAFMNDWISGDYGMDFELYLPWVLGTIIIQIVCLYKAYKDGMKSGIGLPSTWLVLPSIMNPLAAHFGTIRDAVAAGIYAQHSFFATEGWNFWSPLALAAAALCVMVIPSFKICSNVHPFRDYQSGFLPITVSFQRAKQQKWVDRLDQSKSSEDRKGFGTRLFDLGVCLLFRLRRLVCGEGVDDIDDGAWNTFRDLSLQLIDEKTRENNQVQAWWGDFPKAVISAVFWYCYSNKQSYFILGVFLVCIVKASLVVFLRPPILCCLAYFKKPWIHLTSTDVQRAVACTGWINIAGFVEWLEGLGINGTQWLHLDPKLYLGTWIQRSEACRDLLKDPESHESVRLEAITSFEKFLKDLSGDDNLAEEQEEKECIKFALIWEVANGPRNSKVYKSVAQVMNANFSTDENWEAVAHQLSVLRSSDLGEISKTATFLSKTYPQYARAYIGDLVKLMSRQPSQEEEEDVQGAARALQEYQQVSRIRHAASEAVATLAKAVKEVITSKVANSILELLGGRDEDVQGVALTAIVEFRGEACKLAVEKAISFLKEARTSRSCKAAEIVLVKLLPSTQEATKKASVESIFEILTGRNDEASKAAFNVLSRVGGGAAQEVLDTLQGAWTKLLSTLPEMTEVKLQELKNVLKCQVRANVVTNGKAAEANLNLVLNRDPTYMKEAKKLLGLIRGGKDVFDVLYYERKAGNATFKVNNPTGSSSLDSDMLPVFFTDLEPDDIMFAAEMWRYWRCQPGLRCCTPLVIFSADPADKDKYVFEMKILMTALMLGPVDFTVLMPAQSDAENDFSQLPNACPAKMAQLREKNLETIKTKLHSFRDKQVKFYICAPGRGNLGAIVERLEMQDIKSMQCSVQFYSGRFNIKGMLPPDMDAIYKLVGETTLVDAAKYPFFGGDDKHDLVGNMATMALASFAPTLSSRHPLLAAVWALYDEAFNKKRVAPKNLFANDIFDPNTMDRLENLHKECDMQEYARLVLQDTDLERQVKKDRLLTLRSFACGCCDAPLCDQLVFLIPWMQENQPSSQAQTWLTDEEGGWFVNKQDQTTSVGTMGRVKGKQPVMLEPRDVETLYRISEALQDYTLGHLQDLSEPISEADVKGARIFGDPPASSSSSA